MLSRQNLVGREQRTQRPAKFAPAAAASKHESKARQSSLTPTAFSQPFTEMLFIQTCAFIFVNSFMTQRY